MTNDIIVSQLVLPVSPAETCGKVYERFTSDADLAAIPVVLKGRPIGLLKRIDFLTKLADRFGRPLYEGKPVTELMDAHPLIIDENSSVDSLNALLVDHNGGALQHGFIVTENGFYKGIGTAATLLRDNMMRAEQRMAALEIAQTEAEAANRAKTQFLANMSHELRTPLNAIIGFSDFVISEVDRGKDVKDFSGYMHDIKSSGQHLLSVINSILDMSKIESGAFSLGEDYYCSQDIADQVISVMDGMAMVKGVTLRAVGFDADLELYVDARVIKQALMNLTSNAIKFSPDHSSVLLEMFHMPSGVVEICVCDNGPGMDQESLNRVLEPFVQAEAGYDKRFEGSGLGLPLVKAFVEAHGGKFSLESTQGVGTRARIQLPADRCCEVPQLKYVG
ncbi:MAG: sensor histidine kinase [Kordiimonas sp.]